MTLSLMRAMVRREAESTRYLHTRAGGGMLTRSFFMAALRWGGEQNRTK